MKRQIKLIVNTNADYRGGRFTMLYTAIQPNGRVDKRLETVPIEYFRGGRIVPERRVELDNAIEGFRDFIEEVVFGPKDELLLCNIERDFQEASDYAEVD